MTVFNSFIAFNGNFHIVDGIFDLRNETVTFNNIETKLHLSVLSVECFIFFLKMCCITFCNISEVFDDISGMRDGTWFRFDVLSSNRRRYDVLREEKVRRCFLSLSSVKLSY